MTAAAERALAVDKTPRPFLLQLGMIFSLFFGGVCLLLLVLAPFNLASYSISGQPVSGLEFLRSTGLQFGIVGIIVLAIGLGLWLEKAWTRTLMMWSWGVTTAVPVVQLITGSLTGTDAAAIIVSNLIASALAASYLYGKATVVAYYRRLGQAAAYSGMDDGGILRPGGV